jgi:hypothetical protein
LFKILEPRASPVAVRQEPIRQRLGCDHDGEPVDVGGNGLGAPARVDAFDQIAPGFDGFDRGAAVLQRIRPCDPVAADDAKLPGLQRTMQELRTRLDQHPAAVAREDRPGPADA